MFFQEKDQRLLTFAASLLMGIGLSACFAGLLFPLIPSDFSRTKRLLKFIQEENKANTTLVFGSSIAMDGVNTLLLDEIRACTPETTFNLSSPGQNQLESILLMSSFGESRPKRVVHMLNTLELGNQDFLSRRVIFNFLLFGYRPNQFVLNTLSITNNAPTLNEFASNRFAINFENRGLVTNFVNAGFRKWIRNDLLLAELEENIRYPRNYVSRLEDAKRLALIRQSNPSAEVRTFDMDSIKWEILKRTSLFLKAQGIEYTVVLSPVNPELSSYSSVYFQQLDHFFTTHPVPNVQFINLATFLTKEDFVDHIHPGESGAKKISAELAKRLPSCSSKQ